jgi:hypothetical protein
VQNRQSRNVTTCNVLQILNGYPTLAQIHTCTYAHIHKRPHMHPYKCFPVEQYYFIKGLIMHFFILISRSILLFLFIAIPQRIIMHLSAFNFN